MVNDLRVRTYDLGTWSLGFIVVLEYSKGISTHLYFQEPDSNISHSPMWGHAFLDLLASSSMKSCKVGKHNVFLA